MPVIIILRAAQATAEQYEAIRREVRWDVVPPEGAISHAISFSDGGGVEVNVWESREQFEVFFETRLKPVIDKVGVVVDDVEVLEAHNVAIGAPAHAHMLQSASALAPAE